MTYDMEHRETVSYYFVLADKHFGGGLIDWLRESRAEGKSYEWIHHTLWEKDIPCSLPTVVRWCRRYI